MKRNELKLAKIERNWGLKDEFGTNNQVRKLIKSLIKKQIEIRRQFGLKNEELKYQSTEMDKAENLEDIFYKGYNWKKVRRKDEIDQVKKDS